MVFKFRFQQLLDISLFEEDEIKIDLRQNAQIAEITAKINKYEEDYERNIAERAEEMSKVILKSFKCMSLPKMLFNLNYFLKTSLKFKSDKNKNNDGTIRKTENQKTYEILRERDFENFRKEMFKLEQKVLDEFGKKSILTLDDE